MIFEHLLKNKKIYLLIVVIILIVGVAFFVYMSGWRILKPQKNITLLTNDSSSAISWSHYENKNLGFSIWIPNKTAESYGYSPIRIVEDLENSTVYFTPSLDTPSGFQIVTTIADSDQEIQNFIQKQLGPTCTFSKKYLYNFNDYPVYNITADSKSPDVDPNCFVNYKYEVLLYQKTNRVALIKVGQECQFGITGDGGYVGSSESGAVCLDDAILSSFQFED